MNAMGHASFGMLLSKPQQPSCFTFTVNLKGTVLDDGILADLSASKPGIYLVSRDGENAWTRYLAFDYRDPPFVMNGRVFRVSLKQDGRLTLRALNDTSSLLRITVFDKRIRSLNGGEIAIDVVTGSPVKREVVWKKNPTTGDTVGVDAICQMQDGDVLAVSYPRGVRILACRKGRIIPLEDDCDIAERWHEQRHEAAVADEISRAIELADTFPFHPHRVSWSDEIACFAAGDELVKTAFLERLFEIICEQLSRAVVDGVGSWNKTDLFKMHTLHYVVSHLPGEYLSNARKMLCQRAATLRADLPLGIVEKFDIVRPKEVVTAAVKDDSKAAEKRQQHKEKLGKRAEDNRARAGKVQGQSHNKSADDEGKKKNKKR